MDLLKKAGVCLELLLLGDGPERADLESTAVGLGLKDSIHFPGMVANPFTYVSKADFLISASESESFSNVIAEALACQTPVISTDCVSGPREILAPDTPTQKKLKRGEIEFAKYGILVPVNDSETMAAAIQNLLINPSMLLNYSENGIHRAMDFEKEKATELYHERIEALSH